MRNMYATMLAALTLAAPALAQRGGAGSAAVSSQGTGSIVRWTPVKATLVDHNEQGRAITGEAATQIAIPMLMITGRGGGTMGRGPMASPLSPMPRLDLTAAISTIAADDFARQDDPIPRRSSPIESSRGPSAVPAPASLMPVVVGMTLLVRRRRSSGR